MKCEILYIASSEEHQEMAKFSIESLRKVSNLPIAFATSQPDKITHNKIDDFRVIKIEKNPHDIPRAAGKLYQSSAVWRSKILALRDCFLKTPKKTLIFVDADTKFLADPSEIVPDFYDIAACRENCYYQDEDVFGRCVNFYINTGFLILNKNEKTINLINEAFSIYENLEKNLTTNELFNPKRPNENLTCNDQRAFNIALSKDYSLKTFILSNEWNVRQPLLKIVENPKMYHLPDLHKKNNPWEPFLVK